MHPLKVCLKFSSSTSSQGWFFLSLPLTLSPAPQRVILVYTNFPSCLFIVNGVSAPCFVLHVSYFWCVSNCASEISYVPASVWEESLQLLLTLQLGSMSNRWRLWKAINIILGTRKRCCGYVLLVIGLGFVKMVTLVGKAARWKVA